MSIQTPALPAQIEPDAIDAAIETAARRRAQIETRLIALMTFCAVLAIAAAGVAIELIG